MSNFWKSLDKPFVALAPMDDVTDVVFREIMGELPRPDVFFTEFVSADGLCSRGRDMVMRKLRYTENQRPIVAQIWGKNPETLGKAAELVRELKFDGVDINMGCPVEPVVKKGAGAGLIINPLLAKEIIEAVKNGAKDLPVSVKTRIGLDKVITDEWVRWLLEQQIDALTIHARTAVQMSKDDANWQEIGKAVKIKNEISPETIVIGNGDVKSWEQTKELYKTHGVDGVMVGRAVFGNPWVFEKINTSKVYGKMERIKVLLRHMKLYEETWGNDRNFEIMKKFFKMYIKDFDGANQLRQQLMECKNGSQVKDLLLNHK